MGTSDNVPSSVDPKILHSMQHVAKLRELADKHGMGFIGGFMLPDGTPFITTNMEDVDPEEYARKMLG